MSTKKPSPGDITDAYCTRCRMVLNHTIVAMTGSQISRVQCNTCHGTHNFRLPKPATTEAAGSGRKPAAPKQTRKSAGAKEQAEWQSLQLSARRGEPTPYNMNSRFKAGEVVSHPSFGLGLVERLVPPNKVEILFEDGKKLLRCG